MAEGSQFTVHRYALVTLNKEPTRPLFGIQFEGVSATARPVNGKPFMKMIVATLELLSFPETNTAGAIILSPSLRRTLDHAVELLANSIATIEDATRNLSSPIPCIALEPHSKEAAEWLIGKEEIEAHARLMIASPDLTIDPAHLVAVLPSRAEGLALYLNASSQVDSVAGLREYFRFFERAFHTDTEKLVPRLVATLNQKFEYTAEEVKTWIYWRHLSTHADRKDQFATEGDVRTIIPRVKQAALDVLLNKEVWRSSCTNRTANWNPKTGWVSRNGAFTIVKGNEVKVQQQLLDLFSAYPSNLEGCFSLPAGFWSPSKFTDNSRAPTHAVEQKETKK